MINRLPKWIWFGGVVLAFSAGIINSIALLSFAQQAATHVTGIFTHLSMNIARGNNGATFISFFTLFSFFFGSILSGLIIMDAHLKMGRRYGVALMLECLLLLLSTFAFNRHSIWGEYLACMAAGLQNAMVSTYSGTIVRTTHMTGVLTDLGSLIGQWMRGVSIQGLKFKILLGILLAFFWGGFIGVLLYSRIGYFAMLLPAAITGISSLVYFWLRIRQKRTD